MELKPLYPPSKIFQTLEAAGIRKADIARQLGVSPVLVTYWSQGKRPITPTHYEALLDYLADPATLWALVEALAPADDGARLACNLFHCVIRLLAWKRDLYGAITVMTRQLAEQTSENPAQWDMSGLQVLTQQLAHALKLAPPYPTPGTIDPRFDKGQKILSEALTHRTQKREDSDHATGHPHRDDSSEFRD